MRHSDFIDEEFPEGIAADAFDPRPAPLTFIEIIMLIFAGASFAIMFSYCLFCAFEFARDLVQP